MSVAVLVIAHGSPDPDWMHIVEESVRPCRDRLHLPVRIAYLGEQHGRGIAGQVSRLAQEGAQTVVAVPLFVTAGSAHIGEIRQLLGFAPEYPSPQKIEPLECGVRFLWRPPLEDHPWVEQIVLDRLAALSADPRRESLLLVGHGSDLPGYRQHWERLLRRLSARVQQHFAFAAVGHATLRPDTVASRARELAAYGTLIVLPLFISPGYFTRQAIPKRLAGLRHRYQGQAYLPHPAIHRWIVQSAEIALADRAALA